jgi:hypothetical protein
MATTINEVARAIETYLRTYETRNAKPVDVQVRASGDDVDVIKVWVDLGPASVEADDWGTTAEAAIAKDVAGASAFRIQVRVEKL